MGDTIKVALRLFLFALIAGVLLAATNEITRGPIAEQAVAQANEAREVVLPGAEQFEPVDVDELADYPAIQAVHRAMEGERLVGYAFLIQVQGYKGPIVMTLAVNQSGSINALVINSQTETAGLGNKIGGAPFLSQFPGLAANAERVSSEVDAISGATVSSRAVMSGIEQALQYAERVLGIEPKPGEVVTVQSVSEDRAVEQRTGTEHVSKLDVFEASGFPGLRAIYAAEYMGQSGYLFDFEDQSVFLSEDGEPLAQTGGADAGVVLEAQRFARQFLKKEASAE